MNDAKIRDILPGDFDRIVAMNDDEVQWTSPMDGNRLASLVSLASYGKVLTTDAGVAGFLLAMSSDCSYENDNFDWFRSRYDNFLYIDRIVIAREQAGAGHGKAFYNDLFDYAATMGHERVVCEYNILPLNAASRAFHTRMGFEEVGERQVTAGEKVVSMQARII